MTVARAGLVSRVSVKTATNVENVDVQLGKLRKEAATCGWDVVEEIAEFERAYDNDGRELFARIVTLVESGRVDLIAARHADRLVRDDYESALLRKACRRHGVRLVIGGSDRDMDDFGDRLTFTIESALAERESEIKRQRIREKLDGKAERGEILTGCGARRPYGYTMDQLTIVEREAAVIREIVDRVLAGATVGGEADRLNAAGVPTSTGAAWRTTTIKQLLTKPRIGGQYHYRGRVIDAPWSAIVDPAKLVEVRAVLEGRRSSWTRSTPRSYLLSGGLLVCDRCKAAMVAKPKNGRRGYFCARDHGGCNSTSIVADHVESAVREWVIDAVDGGELADRAADEPGPILERIVSLNDERIDNGRMALKVRELRAECEARIDEIDAEIAELRERLAAIGSGSPLASLDGPLANVWTVDGDAENEITLDAKRAFVRLVLAHVVVKPGSPGRKGRDLDRLDPIYVD